MLLEAKKKVVFPLLSPQPSSTLPPYFFIFMSPGSIFIDSFRPDLAQKVTEAKEGMGALSIKPVDFAHEGGAGEAGHDIEEGQLAMRGGVADTVASRSVVVLNTWHNAHLESPPDLVAKEAVEPPHRAEVVSVRPDEPVIEELHDAAGAGHKTESIIRTDAAAAHRSPDADVDSARVDPAESLAHSEGNRVVLTALERAKRMLNEWGAAPKGRSPAKKREFRGDGEVDPHRRLEDSVSAEGEVD